MVPSKPVNINKQIESTIRKGSLSDHTDEPKQAKHLMPANGADSPSESSGALRENRASETANPPGPQRTKYSVMVGQELYSHLAEYYNY